MPMPSEYSYLYDTDDFNWWETSIKTYASGKSIKLWNTWSPNTLNPQDTSIVLFSNGVNFSNNNSYVITNVGTIRITDNGGAVTCAYSGFTLKWNVGGTWYVKYVNAYGTSGDYLATINGDSVNGNSFSGQTMTTSFNSLSACCQYIYNRFRHVYIYYNDELWVDPYNHGPIITYNWQSVPSISGKNGILSLTHVRNDSLLDGGSQTFTPEQVFVSEQSRVGRLMSNVPIGTAIKAIFSGVNFLGIRKDTATTDTVRMVLTEHIQREIYQRSFITDKCYIGFIMDAEQTAGRVGIFFPQYDPQTEILTGYSVNFTDTDYSETDVYNWLLGGLDPDVSDPDVNEPDAGTDPDVQPDIKITGITKPSYGAIDTGFTTMYRMSKGELQRLSAFLWSSSFVDNVKKFFNDPREIIVGLSIMPVLPDTGTSAEIKAGGISTGVYGLPLTDQYKLNTYGIIEVKAEKGNFLDYADTTVTAHLPFVGSHSLDVNDVMGKQLALKYIFDFLSGSCVAEIDVYDEGEWKPRYFFGGSCGIQVPTSSEDFSKMYSSILSAGATLGTALSTIATGGLTAPLLLGNASNMLANGMNGHPTVDYASGSGSINGMIGCKTAYLVISRPKEKVAGDQPSFVGKPSYITSKLNDCSGYTKCMSVHLDNLKCMDEERNRIEQTLLNGVRIETGSSLPEYELSDSDNTAIVFLKCISDRDVIGKTWETGEGDYEVIEGKLIYDTSILKPTFVIAGDVSQYNYCYIPLFDRYYYIVSNTIKAGTIEELMLEVDVLQSWKGDASTGILSNSAIIERQESLNNAYFTDDMYWTQANKEVKTIPFLDQDGNELVFEIPENNYILTIAGSDNE